MKYEALRRIKTARGKAGHAHKNGEVCSACGFPLVRSNTSLDHRSCKTCFDAEVAALTAEDEREDSQTDADRLANFLG